MVRFYDLSTGGRADFPYVHRLGHYPQVSPIQWAEDETTTIADLVAAGWQDVGTTESEIEFTVSPEVAAAFENRISEPEITTPRTIASMISVPASAWDEPDRDIWEDIRAAQRMIEQAHADSYRNFYLEREYLLQVMGGYEGAESYSGPYEGAAGMYAVEGIPSDDMPTYVTDGTPPPKYRDDADAMDQATKSKLRLTAVRARKVGLPDSVAELVFRELNACAEVGMRLGVTSMIQGVIKEIDGMPLI